MSGQDVQGVNSATLVVRELATVALKEADTYLPTNLVPLHIIMFEPAGVNKKQYFNRLMGLGNFYNRLLGWIGRA